MLIARFPKVLQKAFVPVLRDCTSRTVYGHCIYSTQVTAVASCRRFCSESHNIPAEMSCQKLEHRSLVRVCGADVLGFLQGLVTNDMQHIETDDSAMYAMMLNFQARLMNASYSENTFT